MPARHAQGDIDFMTETAPRVRQAAFIFVFITVLLDMLALGMIVPVLPKLVLSFVGGDTAQAAEVFGVFGTAWALMQFLFAPVQGALSDHFGRRPVILLSNFGLGACPSNRWILLAGEGRVRFCLAA
jgi:DHA1 family tetracycline resistance protein-like MFS transporter